MGADFEASKSKFTAVTDDPESKRLAANTRTISNISYHGLVDIKEEQEKKRSHIDPNVAPSVPAVERKQSDVEAIREEDEEQRPRQPQPPQQQVNQQVQQQQPLQHQQQSQRQ